MFNVDDADTSTSLAVELANLQITGGDSTGSATTEDGGGILNRESLTLVGSTISGNFAADDGGGLFSTGDALNLELTSVDYNSAEDRGGGIFAYGTVNISESSVSGNHD